VKVQVLSSAFQDRIKVSALNGWNPLIFISPIDDLGLTFDYGLTMVCYYAPFVKFLLMTGCRTGEAVGLKWKHISADCKMINFCESVSTQLKI
jgi:hypothetical protein